MCKQVPRLIRLAKSKACKGTNVGAQMGHLNIMLVVLMLNLLLRLVVRKHFFNVNVGGGQSARCLKQTAEWGGKPFVESALAVAVMAVVDLVAG